MAGTTAAVDFLAGMSGADGDRRGRVVAGMTALEHHEDVLRDRIEKGLAHLPKVQVHSRAARRTPTLLLTFAEHDAAAVSAALAERHVNAPAGSFYAYEPARRLGLGAAGGLRIGLAPYNDLADVERLLGGLAEALT